MKESSISNMDNDEIKHTKNNLQVVISGGKIPEFSK